MGMAGRSTIVHRRHVHEGDRLEGKSVGTCASGLFTGASNFLAFWISSLRMAFIRCVKQRRHEDAYGSRTVQHSRYSKRETEALSSAFIACLLSPSFLPPYIALDPSSPLRLNARHANVSRNSSVQRRLEMDTEMDTDTLHGLREEHSQCGVW